MAEKGPEPDWRQEFKRVNQSPSAPPASLPEAKANSSERRKFPLFEVSKITCSLCRRGLTTFMGISRVVLEGTVLELSEGGCRVSLGERLFPDTKLHLRLEVPKFKDVFEADATSRWCREMIKHDPPLFYAGIMFVNPPSAMSKKISSMRLY